MAKDPAFLFYPKEVFADTSLMTPIERGYYLSIMCLQWHQGHLNSDTLEKICGTYVNDMIKTLDKDSEGLYFIRWVDESMTKRKEFSDSRRANRLSKSPKKKNVSKTSDSHLVNGNAIVNVDVFLKYCQEFLKEKYPSYEVSLKAKYNQWKEAGWKDGYDQPIKNWKTKVQNTIPHLKPVTNDKHRISAQDLNLPEGTFPLFKKE